MDLLYELWLHSICDFDAKKVGKCIYIFENAYNAYHSKPYSLERVKAFGMGSFLSAKKDLSDAERIIKDCKEKDIRIITIEDEDYPALLKEIYLPPRIIFAKGSLKNFDEYFPISIVGTRHSTSQGNLFTKKLAEGLVSNNNVIIISGMADGIDSYAHKGCLEKGGKTIAVLAGGVDIIYPPSNIKLYYEILKNGAVISEKPPAEKGKPYYYRQRNRIIAGLSKAVIAVEGTYKTGTRHTVNHALENNRDVFTVPSSPMSAQSQYPNELIKDGIQIVLKPEDIIEEYINVYPEYFNIDTNEDENNFTQNCKLTDEEKLIIDFIVKKGGEAHADELAAAIDIPIGKLNGILTMLELQGVLCQQSQNQYLLKEADNFAR